MVTGVSEVPFKASTRRAILDAILRPEREINTEVKKAVALERVGAALTGADTHDFLHRQHENLAVADAARACGALDRVDHLRRHFVGHDNFEFDLGQKINHIFGAAIELGVPFLAAESLYLADSEALHTDTRQSLFNLVELEGLYNRLNLLHMTPLDGGTHGTSPPGPAHNTSTVPFSTLGADVQAPIGRVPKSCAGLATNAIGVPDHYTLRSRKVRQSPVTCGRFVNIGYSAQPRCWATGHAMGRRPMLRLALCFGPDL